MTRTTRSLAALAGAALLAAATAQTASAESFVRIQNVWKPDQQIHVETGPVRTGPTQTGWWSADWAFERADGGHFRIKNRWKGTYLHVENRRLEAGPIQTGWWSAQWSLEPVGNGNYRIKNRWLGSYLHIENGRLEAGAIQPGWWSAMWTLKGFGNRAAAAPRPAPKPAPAPKVPQVNPNNPAYSYRGEQCVTGKFGVGYVGKVRWYFPHDVIWMPSERTYKLRAGARVHKKENVAVFQSSCVRTGKKMFAQISVVGGEIANQAIVIAAGTVTAIGSGVAGAVACAGTAGAACPAAAAGIGAAVSGAVSAASLALPDAKTTFYLGAPKDVGLYGTVWNPSASEL